MSQIILDFGNGNTCKNDKTYIKKMYDELKKVDSGKHEVIVKWQLFKKAGENIPLTHECFDFAYQYGTSLGYKVTSSVFDKESLDYLLKYNIPFVKIANNRNLDWLIGKVPREIPVYVSYGTEKEYIFAQTGESEPTPLVCISNYPTFVTEYEKRFSNILQNCFVSDHTIDFDLWYKYQPEVIEWHYVLEHDEKNLDGGLFARTPEQLSEVL